MVHSNEFDKLSLSVNSLRIVHKVLIENRNLQNIFVNSDTYEQVKERIRQWLNLSIDNNPLVKKFISNEYIDIELIKDFEWSDYALLRLNDYAVNEGFSFLDLNRKDKESVSRPFFNLWEAARFGKGIANEDFFKDFLQLLRQFNGRLELRKPSQRAVGDWMSSHKSGLDNDFIKIREANKIRIIKIIIAKIDNQSLKSQRFAFEKGISAEEKFDLALEWWNDYHFHLSFAARTPEVVNEYLDLSLRPETLEILEDAKEAGIPIFINPYYLSLLSVDITPDKTAADRSLRDYIFHSRELVEEFGDIKAWEMEDVVEPGKPNAAGWILPSYHNIHRRYPEVAIFIPDTVGRACGGLCVSCQRMYDFQSGHLNFNLTKLNPKVTWPEKMFHLLEYFENDTQLREILITGGDSFMNTNRSMKHILDAVLEMAKRKIVANLERPDGEKYAEIQRVRLGTRLPAYLPQRVTKEFVNILADFKRKASKIGIKQFVVQTHIQSAMEITPEVKTSIKRMLAAGWVVTNQLVFTSASSRRGHTAKLRKVLNSIGMLSYYTFSVKGFKENYQNFATNARLVQEINEEKIYGRIPKFELDKIKNTPENPIEMRKIFKQIKSDNNLLFLSTDRSVINLPGVGKSMTYRVVGITNDGRRILEFEYDHNRNHSPVVDTNGKVVIVESKTIMSYLNQMESMGEKKSDYRSIWGYSLNSTEELMPLYKYPEFDFEVTTRYTNIEVENIDN